MYVILRILKHMALVDFVTLPTYRVEQCAMAEDCQENIRILFKAEQRNCRLIPKLQTINLAGLF